MAAPVHAQTATGNLGVSMTITTGCTVTGGTVSFGTRSTLGTAVDQSGTFTVTCTNTTPYSVSLDAGSFGPSVTARRMKGGASNSEYVNYSLFQNAARTTNWGATIGTDTVGDTGNGSAQTLTVYGRVPAQAIGSPGSYADVVTITVTY